MREIPLSTLRSMYALSAEEYPIVLIDIGRDVMEVMTGVGSTFNRGDFTATNAFFWSSLDLSPFAGTDLGSTPYWIELTDGAGKKATGYIGAVGAGEILGGEICDDPGFDIPGNWAIGTGWAVAASKGTATTAPVGSRLEQTKFFSLNALYRYSLVIDSVAAGAVLILVDGSGAYQTYTPRTVTEYWTSVNGGNNVLGMYSAVILTGVVDNLSEKRVTDPPATAVHIVSALNGTTRNWTNIESGFNPNAIVSWKIIPKTGIIRISSDPTVRITEDPIAYGTISNGETYAFFPFDITLPQDEGDTVPRMRLIVPNVSAEIGWWLRSSLIVPMVTVTLISNSDLNTPIAIFPDFELRSFTAGTMSVEGQMILSGLDREPYPAGTFSPSFFPGLF